MKTCVKCGGRMSEVAAVCPHCAARQPGIDPSAARKNMSPDEIRALLLTDADTRNASPTTGLLGTLVLPHPATTGIARVIELVLTIACAPLIIAGTIAIALRRKLARQTLHATTGELMPVFIMALFGALPLDLLLDLLDLDGATRLWIVLGSIGALAMRGVLRARAAAAISTELLRVAK